MKFHLKYLACFLMSLSLLAVMPAVAAGDSVAVFFELLKSSGVPSSISEKMVKCITTEDSRQNLVLESDGIVYALVRRKIPNTSTSDTRAYLKTSILKATLKKATSILPLYVLCPQYTNKGYKNPDAVMNALLRLHGDMGFEGYLTSNLQTQAQIINEYAIALVYIPKNKIQVSSFQLPDKSVFRDAYCRELVALTRIAQGNMNQQSFAALYLEIFELECSVDIEFSLKTVAIFLETGYNEQAENLLLKCFNENLDQMSSLEAEQLGNLLFDLRYEFFIYKEIINTPSDIS